MNTPELYFALLEKAADLCGKNQPDEAIAALTEGGIPQLAAWEQVVSMMDAEDEIRLRQEDDRALMMWRDGGADGRRCMVITTNGTTPPQESREAEHIWKTIVKKAMDESEYTAVFQRGLDPESLLALQAISKADLLVLILPQKAQELGWVLSLAQAWDKPVVQLATERRDCGPVLSLVSPPIHYRCRSTDQGFVVDDSDSLVAQVKGRIPGANSSEVSTGGQEPSVYDIARQIYRQPLRVIQARSLRKTVYRGKLRTLHQFYLGLNDALERLRIDYELEREASKDSLSPFAEILIVTASAFQNDCQCLHQAMQDAVNELPQRQQDESLKICGAMKILLQDTLGFIRKLQTGDKAVFSKSNRERSIMGLANQARDCCQLIPEGEKLVQSIEPTFDYSFAAAGSGHMEALLRKTAVQTAYEKAVGQPTIENVKAFCRAIRSALLLWLGLDRREQGAYDETAREIQSLGVQVLQRFEQGEIPASVQEVYHAIQHHVARFKDRLDVVGEQRAAKDYAGLVEFVGDCEKK